MSTPAGAPRTEDLLRELAPQVLGALVRRFRQFDACEDAVQEALLAAATQWPVEGVPSNPRGWLVTVAGRRMTDLVRSESARRRREDLRHALTPAVERTAMAPDEDLAPAHDDTLTLLFLCCHPALRPPSQVALTLRAVGGLTTAEIAAAFLVPEPTMGQRISRAKATIKEAGASFEPPAPEDRAVRLGAALHVLYLIFNEGYTSTAGPDLQRPELADEAIRLTRQVHRLLPEDPEVAGLLALMLFTDARRAARTDADGGLVPLAEQDRARWDRAAIAEGVELVTGALARGAIGPYQLQAAIAAVHDEAPDPASTDWRQVVALYDLLERVAPNPMASLNRAVAVAELDGPEAGLALVDGLVADARLADHHRLHAVRARLLEQAGRKEEAVAAYRLAARRTTSRPEQRHLEARAARLTGPT